MWEKLKQLARRYDEIGELLEVPEIYADPKKLRALTREQKELEAVVAAYRAYLKCEDDITQALELTGDPELHDMAYAREQLAAMLGPQMQVPPAFSAISVNGVRAYKSAREGNAVDLPPRPVEVYAADLIAMSGEGDTCVWTVAFSVSKGTYIRALARDLGRACDSAAHISALRRTASGVVSIGVCHAVEELSPESATGFALDPIAALGSTRVDLPGNLADDLLCGRRIPVDRALVDFDASKAPFALVLDGGLKALARIEDGRFVMEHVFPQAIGGVR